MALEDRVVSLTLVAASDLSAAQFKVAAVDSNGKAALCNATGVAVGIIQNKPGSGQAATIAYHGRSKAVYGGTVAAPVVRHNRNAFTVSKPYHTPWS